MVCTRGGWWVHGARMADRLAAGKRGRTWWRGSRGRGCGPGACQPQPALPASSLWLARPPTRHARSPSGKWVGWWAGGACAPARTARSCSLCPGQAERSWSLQAAEEGARAGMTGTLGVLQDAHVLRRRRAGRRAGSGCRCRRRSLPSLGRHPSAAAFVGSPSQAKALLQLPPLTGKLGKAVARRHSRGLVLDDLAREEMRWAREHRGGKMRWTREDRGGKMEGRRRSAEEGGSNRGWRPEPAAGGRGQLRPCRG